MDSQPSTPLQEATDAEESWFEALPDDHRRRIVEEDEVALERWEELGRRERLAWRKPVLHGVLLVVSVSAFITRFSPVAIIAGLFSGALIGWLWHRTQAGQIWSPVIAVFLFQITLLLSGEFNVLALIWAPLPIAVVSVWLGMRRHELPGS